MSICRLLPLAFLLAIPAFASDGVIELNHTCATVTGCALGDSAGYPVTISRTGSFRLTSNLTVPAGTNGIEFSDDASLDLGGFEIRGPVTCPLGGCPAAGAGSGVVGGSQLTVTNGRVRGFARDGLQLGLRARVERLQIAECAGHGVVASGGSYVASNQIGAIGGSGIVFNTPLVGNVASLYSGNSIGSAGAISVSGGRASGPNSCSDLLCGTSGKRLFYLTTTTHNGAGALNACAVGFHMASLWEIFDPSNYEYDSTRGDAPADLGEGASELNSGWIRTGDQANDALLGQSRNCFAWTSGVGGTGIAVSLRQGWDNAQPIFPVQPWIGAFRACNQPTRVWCAQD